MPAISQSSSAATGVDAPLAAPSPVSLRGAGFTRNHLLIPVVATLIASALLIGFRGDFLIADLVYASQGHAWILKNSWVTTALIHEAGKTASAVAWLMVLLAWVWSLVDGRLVRWRRPLVYLVVTTLIAGLMISALKAITGMDCPWDLQRYGGGQPFVGLFQVRPPGMPAARCFPSGHASAGYAWVTLYFFFLMVRPRLRWIGLAAALLVGATFGFSQQLRGAHFMSHDLWTAMVCWLVALGGYCLFFRAHKSGEAA